MGSTWAARPGFPLILLLLVLAGSVAADAPQPLRTLQGEHITLITDLPSDRSVDELPLVFDQAVPAWHRYFKIPQNGTARWRVTAYVIHNRERFRQLGLLPADLPPFEHAYQRGDRLWVYEQPSSYYRRHLLLHEGMHAFMFHHLGDAGPPWYMEGMAELFGTHRWVDGRLTMQIVPAGRDEVPYWGRIKLIREQLEAGQRPTLKQILHGQMPARQMVDQYAWSWAAAIFLDQHPDFQRAFRQLPAAARLPAAEFAARLDDELAAHRAEVEPAWQLFLTHLDYGYDVAREAIVRRPDRDVPQEGATVVVAADRAWQSSGLRLRAGESYVVQARGRFQVADRGGPWPCEAGGVTLKYYQGRPLGQLLGALVPSEAGASAALVAPQAIGLQQQITPPHDGTLYLRINEGAGQLDDNQGQLLVTVRRLTSALPATTSPN